jgi:adenylate cyclase
LNNGIVVQINCFRLQEALNSVELYRALGGLAAMTAGHVESAIRRLLGEPVKAIAAGEEALARALRAEASTWVTRIGGYLAIAYGALGRFEEAHRLLADQGLELGRADAGWLTEAKLRVYLDEGDIASAVPQAQSVLAGLHQRPEPDPFGLDLIDNAVEVFVKAGMPAEATQLLEKARTAPTPADNPYLARMEGQVAHGQGDLSRARDFLQAASDFLARVSYRDDEWRTRRALADVKTQMGDRAGAEAELRAVLRGAEEHGHVTHAEAARKQLAKLGVEVTAAVTGPAMGDHDLRQVSERLVTVMFADVRGYTAFSAKAGPPDLADRVATFYRWTEQEIARHHGLVAQYGGDAVMATFNVSGVRLDHCLHALQAAIAIRDKAAYAGLPVGIGVAVGAAVVGQLSAGSPVTAVGETTNLAARLQAKAQAGEIVLSQDAFRRVRDWLHSQQLEARQARLSLKGIGKAVHAFVLPSRTSVSAAIGS